ncbi:MAG: AlpA family phage regulatory protein [Planctomycetaceae bacterium]|nr:AlpA family phage regulatory protein [Planctomycetaceae bacterium]
MLYMATEPRNPEQLTLKAEEVAWLVGVKSGKTILRWVQKGQFPKPMRIEGSTRWSRTEVELWQRVNGDMRKFYREKRGK